MSQPLRVALLATSVEFGGIERVLLNLLQHMEPEVELVPVLFTRTDTKETSFFERLRAMGVGYESLYVNAVRRPSFVNVLVNPLVNFGQAIEIFRQRRFDLIHSHGYRADAFALPLARFLGLPLVSTCHGFTPNDHRLRLYTALDRFVLRSFNRVIAVSECLKQELVAHGVDAKRIHIITNAVSGASAAQRDASRSEVRSRLGISDQEFVFGYVGRLSEEKAVENLVRAAGQLWRVHGRTRLLIVGDGPRRVECEQAVRVAGLRFRVDFAGFQSDPAPWYSAMDAFVLPSLTEGTPMALLEAMANRLPVIASAVGGVPAVISDGANGLLVPPAETSKLLAAMQQVCTNPTVRDALADAAERTVRGMYGVRSWIREMRDVYVQAVHANGPTR